MLGLLCFFTYNDIKCAKITHKVVENVTSRQTQDAILKFGVTSQVELFTKENMAAKDLSDTDSSLSSPSDSGNTVI